MLTTKQNKKVDLTIRAEMVNIVSMSKNDVVARLLIPDPKHFARAICWSLDNIEIQALIKRLKKHIGDKSC